MDSFVEGWRERGCFGHVAGDFDVTPYYTLTRVQDRSSITELNFQKRTVSAEEIIGELLLFVSRPQYP